MMKLRGIEIRAKRLQTGLYIKHWKHDIYYRIDEIQMPGLDSVFVYCPNDKELDFEYEDIVRVKPTDQMVIAEMKKFGGEFAKRLAFAYEAADSENRHILGRSFSELFQTYAEMAIGNMQNHFT